MNFLRRNVLLPVCAFALGGVSTAFAVDLPSSVSPGQVEKRFDQPPTLNLTPNIQIPVPGDTSLSKEAQEQLAKKKFVLKNVVINGATAYKPEDLQFAYEDLLGQTISLLDAQDIARKITALYHNDGYVLSQAIVPPQDVTKGTLTIRVVEGYVSDVILPSGLTDGERSVIESYADKIKNEHPVKTQDLERYLLLINDLPGVTVSGLLRPSATETGAADLALSMTNKEFDASYVFDNRGSKYIGPWQHTLSGTANSLFGMYDSTRVRVFTSSPDFNQLFGADLLHEEPIGNDGTKASFLASHTHTQPGDILTPLDVVGNSNLFEAKVSHPFIRSRTENLVGQVLVDYHDTITDVAKTINFTTDRLRVARAGATYNIIDAWRGNNVVSTQLSQGMDIFGATSSGANRSNIVGDSSFTKINSDVSRVQPLPNDFSVLTAATMQHSFDPLLSDEQFSLGGSEYARAFDPAELLGDQGLAGKAELRYDGMVGQSYFNSYQLYTYYDIGRIWLLQGAAGSSDTTVLSSAGVGARLNLTPNFSANVEADVPLVSPALDQTSYRHDPRLFISLAARY